MATGDGLARVTYLRPGLSSPVGDTRDVAQRHELAADDAASEDTRAEVAVAEHEAKRDELGRDRSERRAENVSLSALTRRGMSRWEMEKTLLSRDLDEAVVEEELQRLESVGLIDDLALAETFVRTQHERKGLGRSALTSELRRRHISQEDIELALEQVDDDDEQARATELAMKRAGQLSSYDQATAVRRLTGFLLRKGYSSSVVRNAVDSALRGRTANGGSSGVRFR
ncbi:MAG: RecX family transcriptional regulator [Microbacteriaceae bacterium]|jgi:regulatory protein|nr:RecX family transcriptional regulator [Microbacteriaceae bacterium]